MKLYGKNVLITGASRGIGRGIAIEMAKSGANVLINYKNNDEKAFETLELIKGTQVYAEKYKCDVSSYSQVSEMTDYMLKKFGSIDVLINNAGISKVGLFSDMDEKVFDSIIGTNIKGVYNCCHNVLKKHMIEKKKGCIINISSMWGISGASCEVIYSASKGAVISFTKALAKELGPSNIRVNCIAPGVIDTEMNNNLSADEKKALEDEIPLGHFGESSDIGKLCVFLATVSSQYITGQVISVDGGFI